MACLSPMADISLPVLCTRHCAKHLLTWIISLDPLSGPLNRQQYSPRKSKHTAIRYLAEVTQLANGGTGT